MLDRYFDAPFNDSASLQHQIQERLIQAILDGAVSPVDPLPSSRVFAQRLKVSRNTISIVYERLHQDGFITAKPRRGYFIDENFVREKLDVAPPRHRPGGNTAPDFAAMMPHRFSTQENIEKLPDWRRHPYPMIFGQVARDDISVARWRDCLRRAGTSRHVGTWADDLINSDDPLLLEQIARRVLPQRGFRASPDELLITVGAQNALWMVATLFLAPGKSIHIEDPGYVDARNIFLSQDCEVLPVPIDRNGLKPGPGLAVADMVYVTPGHQSPTNVTMPMERRLALLEAANRHDFLILEDDYEHELNFVGAQHPTLKALDANGRVIHVGSLTKPLFPGIRLGFVAADREVIHELRALRRLMYRHPSALAQRAMALFLSEGHYDAHIRRHRRGMAEKWRVMLRELDRQLPDCEGTMTTGGSGIWLALPENVSAAAVKQAALERGVVVEDGTLFYMREDAPQNRLRLGFGAIDLAKIAPGVAELKAAIDSVRP
ncbi:PLP-dependent aminotransferase family protein [Celeribacter neptunius]|uniref:GntR family transcriptional regulator / MocR family aminotransferase n=1 Tax=Celeribacter neptunius TaxID=588602 RepID=A0A1I3NBH5_9RHOB|nr:PLP-dependent aminotransferase family protein [Celeribacter neptunius]SFJ06688.1 GntR family transcriptional regulator / MocR family aminotransferase [Celeribacter neptunius]